MTAKATAVILFVALGGAAAFAVTSAADPPVTNTPATVYRTITETRTVHRRVDGHTVGWWRARAIANRREANAARMRERNMHKRIRARWYPTVGYAIDLASRVFNVDQRSMWRVARCESTLSPYATNGRYRGLFQLGWNPYGLSPYDPVANALSTAQTVARDGSWRQWECG